MVFQCFPLVSRILVFLSLVCLVNCEVREYHLAAVELEWDYAPSGMNTLTRVKLDEDSDAEVFTKKNTTNRIGKVYKKVVYRKCKTPSCLEITKERPAYLGILGPILRAEVGDRLRIHFTNKASRNFSVHPHGVFYKKNAEGALYNDGTSGKLKEDDGVAPNKSYTYVWEVKKEHGPTQGDSDCLTWAYHSHINPMKDVNTGLVGALIICKKGTFVNNKHKNIDKDFVLMFTVMDENESWLLDENIKTYCPQFSMDDGFEESNKMHVVNGYFYGNTPGLDMCRGDKVDWHVFGMGNEVDIHTAYFHGHTVKIDGHRKDVASVFPAKSLTAHMTAWNPGKWLLNCLVNDHYAAGMSALFNVTNCGSKQSAPTMQALGGKTREYFIAAEERLWDYAPSGMDNFNGGSLTDKNGKGYEFFAKGNDSIGGKYWKALYIEYTNKTFSTVKEKEDHLGFLGPVIRAEVGDTIMVTFKNKASINYSIQPHGVFYNKSNEGAFYDDDTMGAAKKDDHVGPNRTVVYTWTVPSHVGPVSDSDPNCITGVYTSSVDPIKDVYSGLIGPLLVCKKGTLDANGKRKDVNKEFVLLFTVSNENGAWYIERNVKEFAGSSYEYDDEKEGNLMHGINGYLYGNLPGLDMCLGDDVSWHLIGYGNEVDMHGAHFHGQTFLMNTNRKDTVSLIPGSFETVVMKPDNPGEWAVVCRTNDHFEAGMVAKFRVNKCNSKPTTKIPPTKKKTFYIAAVEVEWDYGPSGENKINGVNFDTDKEAEIYVNSGPCRIGRKYKKAVYREFTGDSFTKQKEHPEYFGLLGPMIKAEVGETIEVVFKNKASQSYSVHPHGVFYDKNNEGALYMDNTTLKSGDKVEPGKTYTYTWQVPARAGPSDADTDCITWAYYSYVDSTKDTNSGLVGPLIICRKGTLEGDTERKTKNVDHEFPLLFTVFDEGQSWYLEDNIKTYTTDKKCEPSSRDEGFDDSNKMNSINGRIFGNLEGMRMKRGEKVNWYLLGLGTEVDMHTVHFHGQTVLARTVADLREDVIDLFPGVFTTVKMTPDSTGRWLLHCHVNDHMIHGMEALYDVSVDGPVTTSKPTVHSSATSTFVSGLILFTTLVFQYSWD